MVNAVGLGYGASLAQSGYGLCLKNNNILNNFTISY